MITVIFKIDDSSHTRRRFDDVLFAYDMPFEIIHEPSTGTEYVTAPAKIMCDLLGKLSFLVSNGLSLLHIEIHDKTPTFTGPGAMDTTLLRMATFEMRNDQQTLNIIKDINSANVATDSTFPELIVFDFPKRSQCKIRTVGTSATIQGLIGKLREDADLISFKWLNN